VDLATHPRRYVSLVVAAEYLECDRRTLNGWIEQGKLAVYDFGARLKIAIEDLRAFEQSARRVG
jgi:excisionase family DNA binding protein